MAAAHGLRYVLARRPCRLVDSALRCRTMAGTPAPWNYLWQPGPYPKTEEEMAAAAKKYGLLREDYEPYPDDGEGLGDYPMLGSTYGKSRSGHIWWDYPELKWNFGATPNFEFAYTEWAEGEMEDPIGQKYTPFEKFKMFALSISLFTIPCLISGKHPMRHPVAELQLPAAMDKPFYHFEKPE